MSNLDPYKPSQSLATDADGNTVTEEPGLSDEFAQNRFPIDFTRGSKHGLALAGLLLGGGAFLMFGLLMFLLHLFLIPGNNQIALHLSSTAPVIFGVFMLVNAYYLAEAPQYVRLWPQGIEIKGRRSLETTWDKIGQISVDDVVGSQRKVAKLIDHEGKTLHTISGLDNFDRLVKLMRSATGPADEPSEPSKPQASQIKRGRKRAVFFGLFGLFSIAGCVFMFIDGNWTRHRDARMADHSTLGKGVVVDRKVAPNGSTKRLYVKVTAEDGTEHTHNFEVENRLYEQSNVGDEIEIKFDPQDARIAELTQGQVFERDDILRSAIASYVFSGIFVLMTLLFFGTAALAWKGYDLKTDEGKLRVVPIGE